MEISDDCSEIHRKRMIAFFGRNVEFLKGKHGGGTYSNHWDLKGYVPPSKLAEAITPLTCIRDVPSCNVGRSTDHYDFEFLYFYVVP
jgi:hypothetical protein